MTTTELPPGIDMDAIRALTVAQRIAVADAIWDTLRESDLPPLSDAVKAELERRAADAVAHPEAGIPWEVVKAKALARLRNPRDLSE